MYAGIDTHKDTLAVAVIDAGGRQAAAAQLPNTEPGFIRLVQLLEAWPVRRVGIEGPGNFGRAIAVHLVIGWPAASRPPGVPRTLDRFGHPWLGRPR